MAFSINPSGNNIYDVGAFDAKTYFAELLRKVQEGAIINISKNGKQVAVLQGKQTLQNSLALEAHKRILERAQRMKQTRIEAHANPLSSDDLKELKNAGRKY